MKAADVDICRAQNVRLPRRFAPRNDVEPGFFKPPYLFNKYIRP